LIVELDAGDPVTGWVERAAGPRESFEGLLEMLAAFDRLRSEEPPAGEQHPTDQRRRPAG
jgi:hypothetical protein